ncbi:PepSY-associated TM helix domain-containing protein [Fodinibius halophilus]|uniref:PepSY domain-containing protein n=1 Tax=Fodinibius halophilus TaxID=1736908 RepID=A0A6M1SVU1_9BACT|nr:PepSY-associated TM helix domain-containing protein [Fodinibius halophilus]NGP87706.1 PepSY domain-containing protein [Fodinibius halophilus]
MFSFKPKKKRNRSLLYKISAWLHLWLGLISGIVVFIVSITGAIYTFKEEINLLIEPFQTVEVPEDTTMLPPSKLGDAVKESYNYPSVWGVEYRGEGRSVMIPYYSDPSDYQQAYVNPYTGQPLHNRHLNDDFFRFIISGHYQLWLPRSIGKPIVAYSTLIFVILLISGLILWWPKRWSKRYVKKGLKISWKSTWRRINYDLHNVVGFYCLLVALVLALTGMVYGMNWFRSAIYWTASGGQQPQHEQVTSDTTLTTTDRPAKDQDILFQKVLQSGVDLVENEVRFIYPRSEKGVWEVQVNPNLHNRYLRQTSYYEQHSLEELKEEPSFAEANGGEQLSRLNYDLHVGSIGGIWTKIIAFIACLVSASLPVTGFIFWWDREKRQLKQKRRKKARHKEKQKEIEQKREKTLA